MRGLKEFLNCDYNSENFNRRSYMKEEKDFDGWIRLKKKLHNIGKYRFIHEGDVWWYAAGENIRTEINGKSKLFSRPILIIKKFGRHSFWGVPLTSQKHEGDWYIGFRFQGKEAYAAIIQLRNVDVARLYERIGQVPITDLENVKSGIIRLLSKTVL